MPETRQELLSKLTKAQHDLAESQTRVTELEALLSEGPSNPSALLDSEGYEGMRALEEIRSLAKFPNENPNPLLRVATDSTLLYANPSSHRLLALWDCEVGKRLPQHLQQVVSESLAAGISRDIDVACGDITYSLTFVPLLDAGYINIYGQNITDRQHAEDHIHKLHRTLGVLSDINQAIVHIRHIPTLLEKVCQIAVEIGEFRMIWIGVIDPRTQTMTLAAHAGDSEGYLEGLERVVSDDIRMQNIITGLRDAAQYIVFNDFQTDSRLGPDAGEQAEQFGYHSLALLPLLVNNEVRGVISLCAKERDFFDDEELRLLDEMAGDIAFAMAFAEQEAQRLQVQTALLDSESRYHRMLDNLLEGAEMIGFDWRYLYVNDASASHGRQSKEVLLRSTVTELYPGIETTEMFAVFRACMEERIAQHFESNFVFPDGIAAWFDLSVQPIPEGIFILSLDITERKRSETALKRYAQRMAILHQIDLGLIRGGSIQALVDVTLKHLRQLVPCQRADVNIIDEATGEAVVFAVGLDGDTTLGPGVRVPIPPNVFEGYDARHLRVFDDFRELQDTQPRARRLVNEGLLCALSALLMDQEHPIGVLGLFADTPGYFTAEHQEIAAEIASQLAIAIHQLQLSEALAHHTAELEQRVVERTADLSGAKERVEALLNNSADGILLVHTDLKIQQTNSSFNRLFACEPDDYFSKSIVSLVNAEDVDLVTKTVQAAVAEQQGKSIEIHTVRKDATVFDTELSIGPIKDDGLVCTIRDISERKLRERQQRYYASLQDNVSDAVTTTDLEFRIQTWNRAAERIYGWRAEEIIGRSIQETLQTRFESDQERQRFREEFFKQGYWSGETVQIRKDGTELEFLGSLTLLKDENGVPFGIIAISHGITERKIMERQLRYQASLQENVSDAVIVTDMEFRIQSWNRAAERIYGWSAEEVIGKVAYEILSSIDTGSDELERNQQQLLEQGWWQGELIHHDKEGTNHNILESFTVIKDESRVPLGVIAVNHDITERKVQERQLRYQASLQENVSDAVIVTDMKLSIQSWNRAAEHIYGWRADEVLGRTITDVIQSRFEDEAQREKYSQDFIKMGWWRGEVVAKHKDGREIQIQSSNNLLKDEHEQSLGMIAINQDITERKAQERQLRYQARLQETVSDAVIVTDLEFRIQSWNGAAERIYGWRAEEVIGKVTAVILGTQYSSPEDHDRSVQQLREQGWWQGEVIQHYKDGSIRHILGSVSLVKDEKGASVGIVSVNRDITERKRVEDALHESEQRFSLLVNSVRDYAIYMLDPHGNITSWNQGAQRIKGYTAQEIIGQNFERFYLPEAIANGDPQRMLNIASIEGHAGEEGWRVRKDGTRFWADVVITPLRDKENQVIGYAKVTRDLTEQKRAQEALNARLEEEHEFQSYLKALHEITIEMTQIEALDTFYERTVEVGLERLGFERLALFLYDKQDGTALGTYGTDPQGNIVDEHHLHFTPNPNGIMQRAFERSERFYIDENVPLHKDRETVGVGWNAATVLWNGDQGLGWLIADNLLSQTPASKPLLDILGLYALTVGTLLAQKQVQIALRESEARYRLLAENITDVILRLNAANEYLYVSPSVRTVLGYEPEELLGQSPFNYIHPDDLATVGQGFAMAVGQNPPDISVVVRFRHKQGHYVWLETFGQAVRSEKTGEVDGFISSSRDISDRKHAEDSLRESEERFRQIAENIDQILLVRSGDDQKVLYISPRYEVIWGKSRESLYENALSFLESAHPDDLDYVRQQRGSKHYIEEGFADYEYRIIPSDLQIRWVRVSMFPIKNDDGTILRRAGIIEDITERKNDEETLRKSLEKEKELNELKSRFVSMASHEFRTPLASILALTETLSAYRQKLDDEQIEQRLGKIRDQVGHLKDIMDDVLQLARLQARRTDFNPVRTNVDSLCRSILDEYQSQSNITHQLRYTCDDPYHVVNLDRKLMRQIVSNLVSNAIKYSPNDKIITVSLKYTDEALILSVRDKGIGIPEADLKYLFEPFHRATNVGAISGTGLGLVITKESVELHGGTISVESQVGVGTTFIVKIPVTTNGEQARDENPTD